jgi:hypothetical protein
MNQKSSFLGKIFVIIFAVSFIIALIIFLQPDVKPLNWLPLNDALAKSKKENKRIILNIYNKWDPMSRQIDNIFSSVDSLKEKLNTHFILAGITIDNEQNSKIARDEYLVERMPIFIMLNSKGKEISRMNNMFNSDMFYYWISDSSYLYIDSWLEYSSARQISQKENRKLMVLIINNPNSADFINQLFSKKKVQLFIMQNFIPVILRKTSLPDRNIIRQFTKTENISENFIYIIEPDGNVQGNFILDLYTQNSVDRIIEDFEKIITKEQIH